MLELSLEKIKKGHFPQRSLWTYNGSDIDFFEETIASLMNTTPAKIKAGIEPDVLQILNEGTSIPVGKDSREEGSIRYLNHWINQKPVGPYRIVFVQNLERASTSALNALLKTIEEPPSRAIFIATTKNPYQIIETILSRVTLMSLPSSQTEFSDFTEDFIRCSTPLDRLVWVEGFNKKITKEKHLWETFVVEYISWVRKNKIQNLPSAIEAYEAIKRNQNARFSIEYMIGNLI